MFKKERAVEQYALFILSLMFTGFGLIYYKPEAKVFSPEGCFPLLLFALGTVCFGRGMRIVGYRQGRNESLGNLANVTDLQDDPGTVYNIRKVGGGIYQILSFAPKKGIRYPQANDFRFFLLSSVYNDIDVKEKVEAAAAVNESADLFFRRTGNDMIPVQLPL